MRVLGIDPGFGRLGIAVLESTPRAVRVLVHDCIETSPKAPFGERLLTLHHAIERHIETYVPECIALETLFFFKNQKTAMDVAHVRGMILALAHAHKISVREFTPLQVKQTVAGYGRADKRQISKMMRLVLHLKSEPKLDDAADALAIAWCALQWNGLLSLKTSH